MSVASTSHFNYTEKRFEVPTMFQTLREKQSLFHFYSYHSVKEENYFSPPF